MCDYDSSADGRDSDEKSLIVHPREIKEAFFNQHVRGGRSQFTPVTLAFFDENNIRYIQNQIQKNLSQYAGKPINFLLSREFAETMVNVASRNLALSHNANGLNILNNEVIKQETDVHLLSLRARARYEKWVLHGDFPRVWHYGYNDRSHHIRGENPLTSSPYQLGHPWRRQYSDYLQSVLRMRQK